LAKSEAHKSPGTHESLFIFSALFGVESLTARRKHSLFPYLSIPQSSAMATTSWYFIKPHKSKTNQNDPNRNGEPEIFGTNDEKKNQQPKEA